LECSKEENKEIVNCWSCKKEIDKNAFRCPHCRVAISETEEAKEYWEGINKQIKSSSYYGAFVVFVAIGVMVLLMSIGLHPLLAGFIGVIIYSCITNY